MSGFHAAWELLLSSAGLAAFAAFSLTPGAWLLRRAMRPVPVRHAGHTRRRA